MTRLDSPDVPAAIDRVFVWLRDHAWPLWLAKGIGRDRDGFHEHLSLDGLTCGADFRRLRVVTRQIYVFSEAARCGVAGADDAVALGLAFLRGRARQVDGGYAWRFSLDGAVIDDRRDLYDHAFVLLALASAYRLAPEARLRDEALDLDSYIRTRFVHQAGGYLESLPPALPRRQNPHMHLLEAYLAAAEAFGEARFLEPASGLVGLFLNRLFSATEGALPEFYDDALEAARTDGRFIVEPGHHAEWIWLLHWYSALAAKAGGETDGRLAAAAGKLAAFMDAYGVHPRTGALIDAVWSDGTPYSTSQRLWPQTERLKAEVLRSDSDSARVIHSVAVLERYFTPSPLGLWFEHRLNDGSLTSTPAPASSLYHLTAAIMVARRSIASA